MSEAPLISVVVPVRNGERTLAACLRSLLQQNYRPCEVIAVDDGSGDATPQILRSFPGVRALRLEGEGASAAKNAGLAAARGAYVAFTDADCQAAPDWLEQLVAGLPEGVAGCGGRQEAPADESFMGKEIHIFLQALGGVSEYYKGGQEIRPCDHNPTCNALFRRSVLEELGGFRVGLWPCEDLELDRRLLAQGHRLQFNPRAVVYHRRPSTFSGLLAMMARYGRGHADLVALCGYYRRLHLLPWLTLFGLAAAALLLAWGGFPLFSKLLLAFFAGAAIFFAWRTRRPQSAVRYSLWLLLTVLAWNGGFWRRWLAQKLAWR